MSAHITVTAASIIRCDHCRTQLILDSARSGFLFDIHLAHFQRQHNGCALDAVGEESRSGNAG